MAAEPTTKPQRRWFPTVVVLLLLAAAALWLINRRRDLQFFGETMGTTYHVKYVASRTAHPVDEIRPLIEAQLARVNAELSTWDPDSTLSAFNASRTTEPFTATPMLLDVMQAAQAVSKASGGAFDITVGPIVNAYGFGPGKDKREVPTDEELEALREDVGYHMIHINAEGSTIRKDRPDIYCDLSAIAKGYGVDVLAKTLEDKGIADYMVEIGGELRVSGAKVDGRPWRIAIEKPDDERRVIQQVLEVTDISIATSGDYRNFFLDDQGHRISHTIDPRTGRPITHHLASATVLHEECMYADAWATALMVLGPDEGYALAEDRSLAASFLVRTPDGFEQRTTTAFKEYLGND